VKLASQTYPGSELELFSTAINWKTYYNRLISQHISGHVLEVGAGIGGTTRILSSARHTDWTCLEPDWALASRIEETIHELPVRCDVRKGDLSVLADHERFDTILYIDVLEHIQDDAQELQHASGHLNTGGRLIVLAPAHQFLFSPFDRAAGHFRRYDRTSLAKVVPPELTHEALFYLDSCGLLLSLGNRLILRQSHAGRRQIEFWDRFVVGLSRLADPLLGYRVGKTVVGVWSKN
jgi:SAM-dependent methyltransferase